MKLLHIDSSILGAASASRKLTAAIVENLRAKAPGIEIDYRDLAAAPLPHLLIDHLPADHPAAAGSISDEVPAQRAESSAVLEEFLAADIVVIGAPMYNFTVPSQLKAWIDRILIAGKTFRYGAQGPEGLVGGKRVILAISRGGVYSAGSPAAGFEHVETYLRGAFGFIGITDPDVIVAEGLAMGPDASAAAIDAALQAAAALKA